MDLLTKFINFIEDAQGENKQKNEKFADAILAYPQSTDSRGVMQPGDVLYQLNNMSLEELKQFFMVGFFVRSISKHPARPKISEGRNYGGTSLGKPQHVYSSSTPVYDFKDSNQKTSTVKLTDWFRMYSHELKSKFVIGKKRIELAKPGYLQRLKGNSFTPVEIYQKGIAELELDQTQYNIAQMGMDLIDRMVMELRNQSASNIPTAGSMFPTVGPMQVICPSEQQLHSEL